MTACCAHGLDRVNSARHEYALGNVTACCAHCNLHKGVLSLRAFMQSATYESGTCSRCSARALGVHTADRCIGAV